MVSWFWSLGHYRWDIVAELKVMSLMGSQTEGEERPMSYTQMFQLLPDASSYYVHNDIFKLVYPTGWTWGIMTMIRMHNRRTDSHGYEGGMVRELQDGSCSRTWQLNSPKWTTGRGWLPINFPPLLLLLMVWSELIWLPRAFIMRYVLSRRVGPGAWWKEAEDWQPEDCHKSA